MSTPESRIENLLLHDGFVRALARSLLSDRQSADDVAQDAWVAALERGGEAASLPRWLAGVVKNLAGKARRGEERRGRRERDSARPETTPSAEEILEREAARARVVEAVLALAEPYRATVLLRYFENLPPRAIAKRQGLPVETVRTRQKRALEMLRARLDGEYGERHAWSVLLLPFARAPLSPAPLAPLAGSIPAVLSSLAVMSTQAKLAGGSAAGIALIALWFVRDRGAPDLSAADEPAPAAPVVLHAPPEEATLEAADTTVPTERAPLTAERPETTPAPSSGAVRVRATWFDGSPAEGIRVLVEPNWHVEGPTLRTRDGLTDARGELALHQLAPGSAFVQLDRGPADIAEVTAGGEAEVELSLPRGFDVHGIVRDPSGAPVAGADIWYAPELRIEKGLVLAQTNAEGRFELRSLSMGYIGARSRGFAPSLCQPMLAGDGAQLALDLVLMGPGGAVEGSVFDSEGRWLAGAWVGVGLDPPLGQVQMTPVGGDEPIAGVLPGPIETRTDTEGRYRIEGLAPGKRRIAVRTTGLGAWRGEVEVVEQRISNQDIRLLPGVSLVGRVVHADGRPARASVEIEGFGMLRSCAATDEEGRYRLDGLESGELVVRARGGRDGDAQITLQAAPGETLTWEARLVKGGSIHGRLLDETGAPLEGWQLQVHDGSDVDFDGTDSEGRFQFQDRSERPHRVEVRSPECAAFAVAVAQGVYPERGELVLRIESAQIPSSFVIGRIVDELGKPVGAAQILVGRPPMGMVEFFYPEASGAFELGPFPPGAWILLAHSPDLPNHPGAVLGPLALAPDETWDCGTVVLARGGTLLVSASYAALSPEAAPEFLVLREGVSPYPLRHESGGWRSEPLQPGSYRLQVRGRGIAAKQLRFEIQSDEATRLLVRLDAGVSIQIRLRAATTDEQAQPALRITDLQGELVLSGEPWLWPDAEGNVYPGDYITEVSLAPGVYRVETWLERGGRAESELLVEPGEDGVEPLVLELRLR